MSFAKKILGTFFEIDDDKDVPAKKTDSSSTSSTSAGAASNSDYTGSSSGPGSDKFKQYFQKLFEEANMPGPDYFEFSKMIAAMKTVPEEQQRFTGAFAGLAVQGLDKAKLLDSAKTYINILDTDSKNFNATLDAAVNDKVQSKKAELEANGKKIEDLTRQINDLNNKMQLLTAEIKENEEKIKNSSSGYLTELENMKANINRDIEKINKYI